jgi:hypothetical protein
MSNSIVITVPTILDLSIDDFFNNGYSKPSCVRELINIMRLITIVASPISDDVVSLETASQYTQLPKDTNS